MPRKRRYVIFVLMVSRIAAFFLMAHFLAGSIVFPLGDFALMKDIPQMYRSYEKIADVNEAGVIDFVGDYLLSGKTLLGHNKNDQPERGANAVQFQHAANFAALNQTECPVFQVTVRNICIRYFTAHLPGNTTDFHADLLRPPLAIA